MATERALRADAERNRRRLLDAAGTLFRERGLEVGVAEIAERAGVGRGTLFRNFPTKEDLVAAIVIERMRDFTEHGRTLLDAPDAGIALFEYLEDLVGGQQLDRCVFEAVADTFLANEQIRAAYAEFLKGLEELFTRAKDAGAVRLDVSAMDVLMLVKGVCEAAGDLAGVEPGVVGRQLDLVRAAVGTGAAERPLRGRPATLADVERAFPRPDERGSATG